MKSNMRIKMPRAVVTAGLLAALAVPTVASAKPIGWDNVAQRSQGQDAASQTAAKQYVLPSSFHSEVTTSARVPVKQPYSPPSGFQSEAHHSAPPTTTSSQPSVIVREVHSVTRADSHTLAIVLAAAALGIALCGTGYALVRLSLIQRRTAETSS